MNQARSMAAGATAALVWAGVERLDRKVFDNDYTDVALLGKFVTRSRAWPFAGVALHLSNGAMFGLAYSELRKRRNVGAFQLALIEHTALFPLGYFVDRAHPARGEAGVERVFSLRAFGQATLRHAVFGAVLGALTREEVN